MQSAAPANQPQNVHILPSVLCPQTQSIGQSAASSRSRRMALLIVTRLREVAEDEFGLSSLDLMDALEPFLELLKVIFTELFDELDIAHEPSG